MTAYLTHYLPAIHSSERCSRVAMLVELHETIGIVSSCLVEKKKKRFLIKTSSSCSLAIILSPLLIKSEHLTHLIQTRTVLQEVLV